MTEKISDAAKIEILKIIFAIGDEENLFRDQWQKISADQKIRIVKFLILENFTLQKISEITGEKYHCIHYLVRKNLMTLPPMRGRYAGESKRKQIRRLLLETNASVRVIAAEVGVSHRTVCYHAKKWRQNQEREAGSFQPVNLSQPRHCKIHGMVTIWPCVACEASKKHDTPGQ